MVLVNSSTDTWAKICTLQNNIANKDIFPDVCLHVETFEWEEISPWTKSMDIFLAGNLSALMIICITKLPSVDYIWKKKPNRQRAQFTKGPWQQIASIVFQLVQYLVSFIDLHNKTPFIFVK